MGDTIAQLGVGGIFAVLLVREVLAFLSKRKNGGANGHSGDRPVEFWQAEQRKAVGEIVVATIVPILANQTSILNEMRAASLEMNRNMAVMMERLAYMTAIHTKVGRE